jgi:hypothetical protein
VNTTENTLAPMKMTNTMVVITRLDRHTSSTMPKNRRRTAGIAAAAMTPPTSPTAATVSRPRAPVKPTRSAVTAKKPSQKRSSKRCTASAGSRLAKCSENSLISVSRMAPTAPTEAASVGVATPAMIEPSTDPISMSGGNSAITTRPPSPRLASGLRFRAGALAGRSKALSATQRM